MRRFRALDFAVCLISLYNDRIGSCFNARRTSGLFFAKYFHVELVWLFVRVPICMNQFFADLYLRKKGTKERSKKDYRTKKVVRKGISITKKGISLGNR